MWAGVISAVLLGIVAIALLRSDSENVGFVVLWIAAVVGGFLFNIGAMAKAVEVGIRSARR